MTREIVYRTDADDVQRLGSLADALRTEYLRGSRTGGGPFVEAPQEVQEAWVELLAITITACHTGKFDEIKAAMRAIYNMAVSDSS